MKGIVIYAELGFIKAITLFPFVITSTMDKETMNHERIHLSQQIELLIIPFYLWYGIEYLVHRFKGHKHWDAYSRISFEREAHENAEDFTYLRKRKFWNFVKYLKSGR